jgi:hypothetical protein
MTELLLIVGIGFVVFWVWRFVARHGPEDASICKRCGADVRGRDGRCPQCGRPIARAADGRDPAGARAVRRPAVNESPVVIHTTSIAREAHALRQRLDAAGIAARVVDRPILRAAGNTQSLGAWRVMVWSGDQDKALQVRHQMQGQGM